MNAVTAWLKALPDGALLRPVFYGLIALAAVMLTLDLREMRSGGAADPFAMPIMDPVRMDRPEQDDQIRPYLPYTRPIGPDDPRTGRPRQESEAAPMQFRLGTHGAAFADGTITPGTAQALEDFLAADRATTVTEIVLHSPGGSVTDATEMARLIRERGLNTRVLADGYCASSCPIVFAGGTARIAAATSWIGVHQVFALTTSFGSLADGMDQGQRVSAEVQKLIAEMGVDPLMWTHAMETPADQLYLFTPEEMVTLRLATEVESAPAS